MAALTAANPEPDTDPAHFGGAFAATPYPGTGKAYIADPARIGPVTGSSLPDFVDSTGALRNHNIFRIEGPAGSGLGIDPATGAVVDWVETTDFSLMGRVYTGTMPGRVNVERASYSTAGTSQQIDVYAKAFSTTQGRLPGQTRLEPVVPLLTFFDAPCSGTVDAVTGEILPPYGPPATGAETQMFGPADGAFWGQVQPAAIPTAVCVKDGSARDANGNVIPSYFNHTVTDIVKVTDATYDPSAGTLTVWATSSDTANPPRLQLSIGTSLADLTSGSVVVSGLIAPPSSVRVVSEEFGIGQAEVVAGLAGSAPAPTGIPVAVNDAFSFDEDSGVQNLLVLANDQNAAGGTVAISAAPRLGTATVQLDGSVTYTPNLNASGSDSFAYSVTANGQTSNTANVTLTIRAVNDAPVAVNDSRSALVNRPLDIAVLANDTDADGATDIVGIANLTQPSDPRATVVVSGNVVTFSASVASTFTFTYQAVDSAGAVSGNTATVTVQVSSSESISVSRSDYVRSSSRLRLVGTVRPAMGQTLRIDYTNSAGTVIGNAIAALPTDAAGNWTHDVTATLPTGTVGVRITTSNNTVLNRALSFK
jgi:hypothetical protein